MREAVVSPIVRVLLCSQERGNDHRKLTGPSLAIICKKKTGLNRQLPTDEKERGETDQETGGL
jgi:hypothetical protein